MGARVISEEPHLPVIEAGELLTRIENGDPLIYDHVAIVGDIDISRVVASKIQIRNCEFLGNVNFAHALLREELDLRGCIFRQEVCFKGASFSGGAGFESCSFKRYATFRDVNFAGQARFQGANFSAIANFGNAVFKCLALFGSARFSELCTNFGEASFLADANFQGANFKGYAGFQSTAISGNADFRGANFNEELNMEFASFQGNAIFLGSSMAKEANFFRARILDANFTDAILGGDVQFSQAKLGRGLFSGSQFPKKASFQGTQFTQTANFSGSNFHKNLFLANAKIHVMRLFDVEFAGQIDLHNSEFARLEVRWPALCHHLAYDGAAYLSLTRNFRNLEWFEDADDCYYHYRRMSQSGKTLILREGTKIKINWSKLLDGLAWISCGYGVRPRHTVFLSGFMIILFALLFWAGDGIVVEPLNGCSPSIAPQEALNFPDNVYFSAMVFTAKTQVKWFPVGVFRYLATVESVLGWLLLALFLVTLGRTMIR
ncbi:MAG: pentapeptide repeat-containing protein [Methanothrix sp.]|nr:pentapeptide repeat-containing protein [Methanothrix sp.]